MLPFFLGKYFTTSSFLTCICVHTGFPPSFCITTKGVIRRNILTALNISAWQAIIAADCYTLSFMVSCNSTDNNNTLKAMQLQKTVMQSLVKIPDITARFYYREFHIIHSSRAQAEMLPWLLFVLWYGWHMPFSRYNRIKIYKH